jgi:hypothetical protein
VLLFAAGSAAKAVFISSTRVPRVSINFFISYLPSCILPALLLAAGPVAMSRVR